MKKTLCFILALSMCVSAFSCSDKKKDNKPENPDIVTEEEAALENPFITLSENDFRTIKVTLTESADNPPFNFGCIDTYNLDFGSRVAACAKEGHYENFHSLDNDTVLMYYSSDEFDKIDQNRPYETSTDQYGSVHYFQDIPNYYSECVYEEQKGNIETFAVYGDTAYLTVDFEPDFGYVDSHEWAVFSYDIQSEALNEIFTFSSTDSICTDFCYAGGKFWYTEFDGKYTLYALDLESCEPEKVYSDDVSFGLSGGNEPVIYQYGEGSECEIFRINTETYELTPLHSYNSGFQPEYVSTSGITAYLEENEETHRCDVISDYYNIKTNIWAGTLIAADENTFTIQQGTMLHFFDIEKKEHYVLEFSEYGITDFAYCDGGIIINSLGSYASADGLYYAIPQLGLVFRLADYEYFYADDSGTASENILFDEYGVIFRVDNYGFFKSCKDYFAFADFYNATVQISADSCKDIRITNKIHYKTF